MSSVSSAGAALALALAQPIIVAPAEARDAPGSFADLVEVPDGLRVVIRRSKTDQTGEGQEVAIPRGYKLRPVEAVQTWLAAAESSSGPVFRSVARGGRIGIAALTPMPRRW